MYIIWKCIKGKNFVIELVNVVGKEILEERYLIERVLVWGICVKLRYRY